ncbi:hypothetical protein thsps117_26150 [Pseudomonas sp. No.117]
MLSISVEVSGAQGGVAATSGGGYLVPSLNEELHHWICGPQAMTCEGATWTLCTEANSLVFQGSEVSLTHFETLILDELVRSRGGVVSKEKIIIRLGRDADHYSGLEMCMSRLQRKFKSHFGQQRLFVAVRNRGYRLTQRIYLAV